MVASYSWKVSLQSKCAQFLVRFWKAWLETQILQLEAELDTEYIYCFSTLHGEL